MSPALHPVTSSSRQELTASPAPPPCSFPSPGLCSGLPSKRNRHPPFPVDLQKSLKTPPLKRPPETSLSPSHPTLWIPLPYTTYVGIWYTAYRLELSHSMDGPWLQHKACMQCTYVLGTGLFNYSGFPIIRSPYWTTSTGLVFLTIPVPKLYSRNFLMDQGLSQVVVLWIRGNADTGKNGQQCPVSVLLKSLCRGPSKVGREGKISHFVDAASCLLSENTLLHENIVIHKLFIFINME